jgi:predicted amidohydrolase YtcJ
MTDLDLLLLNARVRTLDADRPMAEAIGITDGRISAVGTSAELRARAGGVEVIDLAGAAVVPGLIDSHMHPFMGAINAQGADLLDAHTLEDVLRALSAERAKCRPGEWVQGWGLDYNVFEATGISSAVIEDAVGGAPAALTFIDWHTMLASRTALELAGIHGPREFVEHAEIVCVDGRPTGELHERAAMDLLLDAMPLITGERRYALCAAHLRALAAVGITGTHAMDGTLETLELLRELESRGDLVTRILAPFTIEPDTPDELWDRYAAAGAARGRRWRAGVAKFFIDGVIDSGTGWLVEPDSEGEGCASFWPDVARYRRAVRFFAECGFQCVTHATGDRGVREALDAYRALGEVDPARPRHRIEHIETLQPEDLPRFAAEGVIASMQAQHMMWLSPDRSDNWSMRLGEERCDRAFPTRDLLESGATVTLGSDWPVARYDPREGMAAARLRRPPGHPARDPYDDQAISALDALAGYTTAAAFTGGDTGRLGQVTPGFFADLTVFADDPVEVGADALLELPVLMTVVDGEIVFRAGD